MREFFHKYKQNHRRAVLATGLFILYFVTIAVAGWLGMRPEGIWIIGGFFVVVGLCVEAVCEHY